MAQRPEHVNWETLPCGCKLAIDDATQEFFYEPCHLECSYYQYLLAETAANDKPIEFRTVDR